MKAVLSKVVGGPETLVIEDIPAPELRPGWARVKVKAVVSGLKHEAANKVRVIDLAADWAPTAENLAEWAASDALPAGSFVFVPGTPIELKTIVE
jgi:hypothetical protein